MRITERLELFLGSCFNTAELDVRDVMGSPRCQRCMRLLDKAHLSNACIFRWLRMQINAGKDRIVCTSMSPVPTRAGVS